MDSKIQQLRAKTIALALENREILEKYSDDELAKIYNGLGPDFFPARLRNFVTGIFPELECAALIHDVEWHESDGNLSTFNLSNCRFERNAVSCVDDAYPCWRLKRYTMRARARRFASYCDIFGWGAWKKNAKKTEV